MLQIPRGAEREYLLILGVAAIYGTELPAAGGFLGVSRDLNLSLQSLHRRFPEAEIAFSLWVKDRATAEALRREANLRMPAGPSSAAMRRAIDQAADKLGVVLTEHAIVMARVNAVVRAIEDRIDAASKNGELQWFNSAFREWRLQARSRGRVMTYSEARARLRRAVIEQGLSQQTFREPLPMIFPKLPELNFH